MKTWHDIMLDFEGQSPVTLETILLNDEKDLGVRLSIGKWQGNMGGSDGESISLTLSEFDSLIIALRNYRELVTDRSEDHG